MPFKIDMTVQNSLCEIKDLLLLFIRSFLYTRGFCTRVTTREHMTIKSHQNQLSIELYVDKSAKLSSII